MRNAAESVTQELLLIKTDPKQDKVPLLIPETSRLWLHFINEKWNMLLSVMWRPDSQRRDKTLVVIQYLTRCVMHVAEESGAAQGHALRSACAFNVRWSSYAG